MNKSIFPCNQGEIMSHYAIPTTPVKGKVQSFVGISAIKEIGLLEVVVLALMGIGLPASALLLFSNFGVFAGGNLIGVLTITFLFFLIHAFTYSAMGASVRRYAADYLISTRAFSAPIGFANSLTLMVVCSFLVGAMATLIPRGILPVFFQIFDSVAGTTTPSDWMTTITTPAGIASVGTIVVVIGFFMSMLPRRIASKVFLIGLALGVFGWVVLFFQLAVGDSNLFSTAWDRVMGNGQFLQVIPQATLNGLKVQNSSGFLPFSGSLLAFWVFMGYFGVSLMAGEVKKPEKNLFRGNWIALGISWIILVLTVVFAQRIVSLDWLTAESYLYQTNNPQATMPWLLFYALILKPNLFWTGLVCVIWFFGVVNLVQFYLYFCSRTVQTWVEDGIFPKIFGYVHPQLNLPLIALLLTAALMQFGVANSAYLGSIASSFNLVLMVAILQIIPVFSTALYPYVCHDWFSSVRGIARVKLGSVPLMTISSGITLMFLAWVITFSLLGPGLQGIISVATLLKFGGLFVAGLIWYIIRSSSLKARDVQLSKAFDSLPEE
jgi:amino acid transporter